MQELEKMFEDARRAGLFADYDFCVRGSIEEQFSGGQHVSQGARLFDISSLTKALTYLLLWKLFHAEQLSPDDSFDKILWVPNVCGRKIRHFLMYFVQDYAFDFNALRSGDIKSFRGTLLSSGFGHWKKSFGYDNYASAFIGLLLEKFFGDTDIEEVLQTHLLSDATLAQDFLFHPVYRELVSPDVVVPTRTDYTLRGFVHDPLAFHHQDENIAAAGLFSTATIIADIFNQILDPLMDSGFYDQASSNQLDKVGITKNSYSIGFDLPYPESLHGFDVEGPLVFGGWTGCRIFFAKKPRIRVCFLTNRVFSDDSGDSRKRLHAFTWSVMREVLRHVPKG